MQNKVIQKLFGSFIELERAIIAAKQTLNNKENPPVEIIERIDQYLLILSRQRDLGTKLCEYASAGEWDQVSRHVRLINGLSAMIRDDAKDIISYITANDIVMENEVRSVI